MAQKQKVTSSKKEDEKSCVEDNEAEKKSKDLEEYSSVRLGFCV